ncbi:MAG: hypothetical protein M3O33_03280 [Cyanobacteriota bacterium]|nr:hypothetical protein [Cyanobacteriota bacterium]
MTTVFTPEEINALSANIDSQLQELRIDSASGTIKGDRQSDSLPTKQSQAIEEITKEKSKSFLKKFGRAAKTDLCEEGGLLNSQWKKWADLDNKDVIDKFVLILAPMGFSGAALEMLVVAVAVIVIHIGVKAFCEDYSE